MTLPAASPGWLLPSGQEMIVIMVVGVLLFGRRLPEVGRSLGRAMHQMRLGYQKLKQEIDMDSDLRDVSSSLRETKDTLTRSVPSPRALRDPGRVLRDLTDETLASPFAGEAAPEVPESLFQQDDPGNGKG